MAKQHLLPLLGPYVTAQRILAFSRAPVGHTCAGGFQDSVSRWTDPLWVYDAMVFGTVYSQYVQ